MGKRGHLFRSGAIPAQAWLRNHGLDICDCICSRGYVWAYFCFLACAPCEMSSVRRARSHAERQDWQLVGRNMRSLQDPMGFKNERGLTQCRQRSQHESFPSHRAGAHALRLCASHIYMDGHGIVLFAWILAPVAQPLHGVGALLLRVWQAARGSWCSDPARRSGRRCFLLGVCRPPKRYGWPWPSCCPHLEYLASSTDRCRTWLVGWSTRRSNQGHAL